MRCSEGVATAQHVEAGGRLDSPARVALNAEADAFERGIEQAERMEGALHFDVVWAALAVLVADLTAKGLVTILRVEE